MGEELPSGWLPPRAPVHPTSTEAPPRAPGEWPRPPAERPDPTQPPSSPLAVAAIGVAAGAILLLLFTAGVSYSISLILGLVAFALARSVQRRARMGVPIRPGQARAAVIVAGAAVALAGVAALVWIVLAANGITPSDLSEALQREADRLRSR